MATRTAQQLFDDPWLHVEPLDCQPFTDQVALPMSITWDLATIAVGIQDQVDATVDPANVVLGSEWNWLEGQCYLPVTWRDTHGVGEGYVLFRPRVSKEGVELLIDVRVAGYVARNSGTTSAN